MRIWSDLAPPSTLCCQVIARVESRQFGTNAAVVAEYLQALVATGAACVLARCVFAVCTSCAWCASG